MLEDALATHGIPDIITTDQGLPYNGEEFRKFAQNMGFTHRLTTPESAQANGFAEIFVKTLVKLIHTAVANKKDPKRVVQSYLMAYRATPHSVTGKSPAALLFNRKIQTKLPRALQEDRGKDDAEIRARHRKEKEKQKMYYDQRKRTKEKQIKVGDEIMLQQQKTTIRCPFDPDTYKVKEIKGSSVVAERRGRELFRAKNLIKVVKQRPHYLRDTKTEKTQKMVDEDIDIDVDMEKIRRRVAEMEEASDKGHGAGEEIQLAGDQGDKGSTSGDSDDSRFTITYDEQEAVVDSTSLDPEEAEYPTTRSGRAVVPPDKFVPEAATKKPRLSPRERKRRQSLRKKEKNPIVVILSIYGVFENIPYQREANKREHMPQYSQEQSVEVRL